MQVLIFWVFRFFTTKNWYKSHCDFYKLINSLSEDVCYFLPASEEGLLHSAVSNSVPGSCCFQESKECTLIDCLTLFCKLYSIRYGPILLYTFSSTLVCIILGGFLIRTDSRELYDGFLQLLPIGLYYLKLQLQLADQKLSLAITLFCRSVCWCSLFWSIDIENKFQFFSFSFPQKREGFVFDSMWTIYTVGPTPKMSTRCNVVITMVEVTLEHFLL